MSLDKDYSTPLHDDSLGGSLNAAKYLTLEKIVMDPTIHRKSDGYAPVHLAFLQGLLNFSSQL